MHAGTLIETLATIHRAHDALVKGTDTLRELAHKSGHEDAAQALERWREHYRHPPVSAVLRAVEGPQHEPPAAAPPSPPGPVYGPPVKQL